MNKKEMILRAATRLFAVKGFHETSSSEIARCTKAAEGTIFYHFGNKEKLFLAVLEQVKNDIIREFAHYEATHRFKDGLEMMEGVLGFYLYLSAHLEDAFLLIHRHYPHMLAMDNEQCRLHLEAVYNCLADVFERAILRGIEDGSMSVDNPRKAALIIFTMVDGLARFRTYNLYDAGALVGELNAACRKILSSK